MSDKDMTEKTLEDFDDVFADIVNVLLFNGQRLIEESDLSPETARSIYKADRKLHEQERDVAKYWKNGLIRLALLGMENQTVTDADMPLRVIGYDGAAYRNQLNADKDNIEAGRPKERYPVVTMVLYFGYKHHWKKHRHLLDSIKVPEALKPFVHDYPINLFEIAWLSDEQLAMFKSDFRIVADYFVQMRKNKNYQPSKDTMNYVHEVLQLMSVVTDDSRFEEAQNYVKRSGSNMCEVLDAIENRGIEKGIAKGIEKGSEKRQLTTVTKTLSRYIRRSLPIDAQVLEDIAEDNELTVEKVRSIAKENGISLSC